MGIGFKLAPGVRIRVSSRGVRAGIGPRVARVHVGSGRTTVSSGIGPVTVWSGGGRRRRSTGGSRSRSRGPTVAQLQRQAAAADRAQREEDKLARIHELLDTQIAMTSAHTEVFEPATHPVLPPPTWVTPAQYLPDLERRHLDGIGRFNRSARSAARAAASAEAAHAADRYNAQIAEQHARDQAELDQQWQALLHNDPDIVLAHVNDAFADNDSPAVAVALDGPGLSVLMVQPSIEQFPNQKADRTPSGRPTIKKMTKTEQRSLWTDCTVSRAAATIAEALAVAPAISEVRLAVVAKPEGGFGQFRLILAGDLTRAQFTAINWQRVGSLELLRIPNAFVFDIDRFGALREISTQGDPHLEGLIAGVNGAIDIEPEDEPSDGRLSLNRRPQPRPTPAAAPPSPAQSTVHPAPTPAPLPPTADAGPELGLDLFRATVLAHDADMDAYATEQLAYDTLATAEAARRDAEYAFDELIRNRPANPDRARELANTLMSVTEQYAAASTMLPTALATYRAVRQSRIDLILTHLPAGTAAHASRCRGEWTAFEQSCASFAQLSTERAHLVRELNRARLAVLWGGQGERFTELTARWDDLNAATRRTYSSAMEQNLVITELLAQLERLLPR